MNPTVKKLGVISFFADIASEMLYPITPIFLTTILGASMGSLGLIEGVAEAIAGLLKTYSGSWSDKINKRKPFIIIGYFLAAISKPFIGMSSSWVEVLFARGIDRTGKGIRTAPRDALIADAVASDKRGEAFGWHRAMDTMGATLGPILALLLLNMNSQNLRSIYYWALIPGLVAVLLTFFINEEKKSSSIKKEWQNPLNAWKNMDTSFKRYILAWTVFSLVNSSDVFLLLKAKNIGMSTSSVIYLYCSYNLTYAFSSPYLGKLSDKLGSKKILIVGMSIFCCVYLAFALASKSWHLWPLFLIYGLYMGATDGVGKSLAVSLSPSHLKGTAIGILGTATGLSVIFASTLAGFLWDFGGPMFTFVFGAIGSGLAALLLMRVKEKTR